MTVAATNEAPLLEMSRLRKTYGGIEVLKGIDLTVRKGEVIALVGSSGSGKTTLLRCVNLLEQPTSGCIKLEGRVFFHRAGNAEQVRLPSAEINKMRSRVGMVFQQFNLFPHMSVLENVMEGPRTVLREPAESNRARAMSLLSKVGLIEFANRRPDNLSGGQKQRVSIARALNMQPVLMLFDEPTSALDPELIGEVLKTMIDLAREGMTMIVVTHELGFALEVADRVVFLDGGLVAADGPPREVLIRPPTERLRAFVNRFHEMAELMKPLLAPPAASAK